MESDDIRSTDLLSVSYGMGTNGTALLCGFRERGIKPDLILTADTGDEKPNTYDTLADMQKRVKEWWGMEIIVVTAMRKGQPYTLSAHCLRTGMLPSLAYGRRSCSQKFKHEPMERVRKQWVRSRGRSTVVTVIGYHAEERWRVDKAPKEKRLSKYVTETYWYPLLDWGWRDEECRAAICRHGLPQPGKSACYFCPASRPSEVYNLMAAYPHLAEKALEIERNAQAKHRTRIGLGGSGNMWSEWIKNDQAQAKLLDLEPMHRPCGCSDGG